MLDEKQLATHGWVDGTLNFTDDLLTVKNSGQNKMGAS